MQQTDQSELAARSEVITEQLGPGSGEKPPDHAGGWVDGWKDGWMVDGRMDDRWMDVWVGGQMVEWMVFGWMDGKMGG